MGGALVVMRRFSVSRFWNVVRDHKVTQILSFSSIPLFLLKAAPPVSARSETLPLNAKIAGQV